MALLAQMKEGERCDHGPTPQRNERLAFLSRAALSEDALGPLLAGALFVDVPRAIFSPFAWVVRRHAHEQPRGGDRAEALERAFERLWRRPPAQIAGQSATDTDRADFSNPFLTLFYSADNGPGADNGPAKLRQGMPIWIANGTDMATGRRILTVPFKPTISDWPFRDAADALSALGADVPVSTAINNTARFPYLEPAGELLYYEPSDLTGPPPLDRPRPVKGTAEEVLDGGYFENEGLQTALDLADWLRHHGPGGRAVKPIIIQATGDGSVGVTIDDIARCGVAPDDPAKFSETRRPLQLFAPVAGLYSVRGGHSAVLLRQASDTLCPAGKEAPAHFFHFYLPAQGTKDVPLNWILSNDTARFIWHAIDTPNGSGNIAEEDRFARTLQSDDREPGPAAIR